MPVPPPESLEDALLERELEVAYLDLRNEPDTFTMHGTEHGVAVDAPWGRVFDGVIYIREMTGLASDPSG